MKLKIVENISDGKNGFYAKTGDEAILVNAEHHPVLILEIGQNRFPAKISATNLTELLLNAYQIAGNDPSFHLILKTVQSDQKK